ncbi:hypothetical protein ABZ502_17190 [Streptomyces abikoensis]|uniref:hypothetical protein n=1 Tax=Streptomyces abikoensis TaxID=97398 RepID=UPI0033F70004
MTDYTPLVAAAAHAAGPCPEGQEAAWHNRVRALAIDLAFTTREVDQAIKTLDAMHTFSAYLEKVEIEPSSRRGLLTLRPDNSGTIETIRTEQKDTVRGAAMIARAQELTGRWVLVYRYNEPTAASKKQRGNFDSVRMVARLIDLGEGALAFTIARELATADAANDARLAGQIWREAGLPEHGMIPVADLEPVRRTIRERTAPR